MLSVGQCDGGDLHAAVKREEVDRRVYRDLAKTKASIGTLVAEVYNRQ